MSRRLGAREHCQSIRQLWVCQMIPQGTKVGIQDLKKRNKMPRLKPSLLSSNLNSKYELTYRNVNPLAVLGSSCSGTARTLKLRYFYPAPDKPPTKYIKCRTDWLKYLVISPTRLAGACSQER